MGIRLIYRRQKLQYLYKFKKGASRTQKYFIEKTLRPADHPRSGSKQQRWNRINTDVFLSLSVCLPIEFPLPFRYNKRMEGGLFSQEETIFSVEEISKRIKLLLEGNIGRVTVEGEVSSFSESSARHWYFSLKDSRTPALLSTVCFSYRRSPLIKKPVVGDTIRVEGRLSAYDAKSSYQLIAESIRPAGRGDLFRQMEELKQRLYAEGLFDAGRKRPLPPFPQTVGVVTSAEGKVFRDICSRIRMHGAPLRVILLPAAVQGAEAAASLIARIRQAGAMRLCDVLIVGRGGGSPEDLLPFSDEGVVRAVAESEIPVISAVGHEPDTPLCDFAADHRSATPTAAADDICAGYDRCRKAVPEVRMRIAAALRVATERKRAIFSRCDRGRLTELLERRLQGEAQRLDFNRARLPMLVRAVAENARRRLEINRLRLEKESPTVILSKGYALVFDENGRPVTRAAALPPESRVTLQFTDGRRSARITEETIP